MLPNRKEFFLCPVLLLCAACQKDFVITIPPQSPQLVVNSVNTAGDTVRVQLSQTIPPGTFLPGVDPGVKNASVVLYEDGIATDTLAYRSATAIYYSSHRTRPGHVYTLRASAPGLPTAEASASVPTAITATTGVRRDAQTGHTGNLMDELGIGFRDEHGYSTDFYRFRFRRRTGNTSSYTSSCIEISDPSAENLNSNPIGRWPCYTGTGVYVRDVLFDGQDKNFTLLFDPKDLRLFTDSSGTSSYTIFYFDHLSEDYFKYLKSYDLMLRNGGNPFAEPSNVHTNVQNGYGIFTIVSTFVRELK